ncbi:mandelate racemase/muconate lactonizing enzyme family protein [Glycomyces terrestris]|uniref:Mandelate racemase/muconate lactonizing enzyme family protein n=1 Tax=Glycomyces terrestris TaxID=2493553 RepID=A0A426UUT7_9ACTN|nr:mandelate racemase/muconate lactonizing enzyme family protein [Glycomyces terrestris]RRR98072.1 mandelate racemase/muconate lactonizing enzyme family protein [Glycomyces terrestris]
MRITGYRTLTTVQEWARPVGDANGVFADGVTVLPIVLVDTDEGATGVGLGSHAGIADVFSAIDGEDPRSTAALYDRMLRSAFKAGHAGAVFGTIGALDTALWDLKAQFADEPLWRLLGGRDRVVPAYASGLDIGLGDEELAAAYGVYAGRGLRAAKLKGGLDVEADRRRLTLVRDVLADAGGGARPGLMLDANETWSRKQAVRHVRELERTLDLAWIEEPVRRWDAEGLAVVQRGVRAAVATGENLTGLEQFRPLLHAGAVDIVQTAAVHGVTHFLRVAALAHAHDLPVSPIGNVPVGLLHAATAVPNHLVSELQDLWPPVGVTADLDIEDGAFVLGDAPGLGLKVCEQAVADLGLRPGPPDPAGPGVRPARAGLRLHATETDPATDRSRTRPEPFETEAANAAGRVPADP